MTKDEERTERIAARSQLITKLVIEMGVGTDDNSMSDNTMAIMTEALEILVNAIDGIIRYNSEPAAIYEKIINLLEKRGAELDRIRKST